MKLPILSSALPKKIRENFYKIFANAVSNKKYAWGIRELEKYPYKFTLSGNELYRIALLYDHFAMNQKNNVSTIAKKYLKKAEEIYRHILKTDPNYLHANYGIGRIYGVRGNYNKALEYQKLAYKQMLKLTRNQRGALGIGYLYKQKGDFKKAEEWYRKELRVCKANDFGTTYNLFQFYKDTGNKKKALIYGTKMTHLIKREFNKKMYRGLKMQQSNFVKSVLEDIKSLK